MILWCHEVTTEGESTIRLICELQEKFSRDSLIFQELGRFGELAEDHLPLFTAANMFAIRRQTITQFISVATAYVIILIQLNNV